MIDWGEMVLEPNIEVFGEPAVFQAAAGGLPASLSVIFDAAFKEVKMSEYGEYHTSIYPAAGCNLSDFPAYPKQGDNLTLESTGQIYTIREVRDDSHGGIHLILNKGPGH